MAHCRLPAISKELQVTDDMRIVGAVAKSEVPTWLDRGEIFLRSTSFESFGIAVMEAAACGLPVVSTDAGEMPYLWDNGEGYT